MVPLGLSLVLFGSGSVIIIITLNVLVKVAEPVAAFNPFISHSRPFTLVAMI